jgi:NitT/TauT family transport system permease protein
MQHPTTVSQSGNGNLTAGSKIASFFYGQTADGQPKSFWKSGMLQWIVSIAAFVMIWELLYMLDLINAKFLPPPHLILREVSRHPDFFKLEYIPRRGNFFNLPTTIFISMRRVFFGLAIAFIFSFVIGLLISYVPIIRRLVLPIIRLLAPISPIAWLPLIQFFIGVGDAAIITVIFVALFFILTLGTIGSIENVEKKYINVANVLGASRWQVMMYVTVPAIVPDLFFSLRMNFFAAWMSLLVAEFIGAQTGLGQMVMAGRLVFNMQLVLLSMGIIGILGMLSELVLRLIQEKMLWWNKAAEI